jgi:hypothetical protein
MNAAGALCFLSIVATQTPTDFGQQQQDNVLFRCGFETDAWFAQWGERTSPARVAVVDADPERGFDPLAGKALRIRIEKDGHYGLSLAYRFRRQLGYEPEEIYFRYYLRFADDWNPKRGGKLPGIGGTYGRAGWGGRPVHGNDGWSARGLFQGHENRQTPIGFYCYHMDMRGRYGSGWRWDRENRGLLDNNRWYCIEQYVKLNAPGASDGILRGWVDEGLAFEKTDIRFRSVDTLKIETVWVNFYLGGTWVSDSEHHAYIDEVVISKRPIGLIRSVVKE